MVRRYIYIETVPWKLGWMIEKIDLAIAIDVRQIKTNKQKTVTWLNHSFILTAL